MHAMLLKQLHSPLVYEEVPTPSCKPGELLVKVSTCGVCRTDLHILDGDLPTPKLPLILGHEIVGRVEEIGDGVTGFQKGDRVGIPWMGGCCGSCAFCTSGRENLCDKAEYTGYHRMGGFAEYTTCNAAFAIPLDSALSDAHLAPLLCAGLIGFRSYRKASAEKTLGLYGFGAAAHILAQIATHESKQVFAFTRKGDTEGQAFAREMGAVWAGDSTEKPPVLLDAAIILAPVGEVVPLALKSLNKGGRCVCGGIHMSDIPSFPYKDLWGEKALESVTNLTRRDAKDFFSLIKHFSPKTEISTYPLSEANRAIADLKNGKLHGAAVLTV